MGIFRRWSQSGDQTKMKRFKIFLIEAKTHPVDIWKKYYKSHMTIREFEEVVKLDPSASFGLYRFKKIHDGEEVEVIWHNTVTNLTKFSRILLDLYKKKKFPLDENTKEIFDMYFWFKGELPNINKYKNINKISKDIDKKHPIVYKKGEWVVRELNSKKACQWFAPYEETKWCTSQIDGSYYDNKYNKSKGDIYLLYYKKKPNLQLFIENNKEYEIMHLHNTYVDEKELMTSKKGKALQDFFDTLKLDVKGWNFDDMQEEYDTLVDDIENSIINYFDKQYSHKEQGQDVQENYLEEYAEEIDGSVFEYEDEIKTLIESHPNPSSLHTEIKHVKLIVGVPKLIKYQKYMEVASIIPSDLPIPLQEMKREFLEEMGKYVTQGNMESNDFWEKINPDSIYPHYEFNFDYLEQDDPAQSFWAYLESDTNYYQWLIQENDYADDEIFNIIKNCTIDIVRELEYGWDYNIVHVKDNGLTTDKVKKTLNLPYPKPE